MEGIISVENAKLEVLLLNLNNLIMSTISKEGKGIHTRTPILQHGGIIQKPPPGFQAQEKKSNLEDVLSKFIDESSKRFDNNDTLLQ